MKISPELKQFKERLEALIQSFGKQDYHLLSEQYEAVHKDLERLVSDDQVEMTAEVREKLAEALKKLGKPDPLKGALAVMGYRPDLDGLNDYLKSLDVDATLKKADPGEKSPDPGKASKVEPAADQPRGGPGMLDLGGGNGNIANVAEQVVTGVVAAAAGAAVGIGVGAVKGVAKAAGPLAEWLKARWARHQESTQFAAPEQKAAAAAANNQALQDMRLLTYQGDAVHEAAAAFSAAQQRGDAQGAAEARKKAYDATDAFAAEAVRATRAHTERMEKDPELNRNGAAFDAAGAAVEMAEVLAAQEAVRDMPAAENQKKIAEILADLVKKIATMIKEAFQRFLGGPTAEAAAQPRQEPFFDRRPHGGVIDGSFTVVDDPDADQGLPAPGLG